MKLLLGVSVHENAERSSGHGPYLTQTDSAIALVVANVKRIRYKNEIGL